LRFTSVIACAPHTPKEYSFLKSSIQFSVISSECEVQLNIEVVLKIFFSQTCLPLCMAYSNGRQGRKGAKN